MLVPSAIPYYLPKPGLIRDQPVIAGSSLIGSAYETFQSVRNRGDHSADRSVIFAFYQNRSASTDLHQRQHGWSVSLPESTTAMIALARSVVT
jgi:hypothetical protein